MIFSKCFKNRIRKKNERTIPCYGAPASFNDTAEGCSLWNWDKSNESYYAVREVFKTFPNDVKHALAFVPKDGELCERVHLWRSALKPAFPPALFYNTMRGIYSCYKRCKRVRKAEMAAQATYTKMTREV